MASELCAMAPYSGIQYHMRYVIDAPALSVLPFPLVSPKRMNNGSKHRMPASRHWFAVHAPALPIGSLVFIMRRLPIVYTLALAEEGANMRVRGAKHVFVLRIEVQQFKDW